MQNSPTEYLKPRIVEVDLINPNRAKVVLEPMERGFGFTLGNNDLCKADPISANSTKFFSSHSIFAPKSKTIFIPFLFGHKPAKAGLLTPLIVFKIILEITRSTPVFPADKVMSLWDKEREFTLFHILLFLDDLMAVSGVSSSDTSDTVWNIL